MNIHRLFRDGVAYEASQQPNTSKRAFDELVQEITTTPKFIGSRSACDVAYLLMEVYYVFVKQLPQGANFKFKAEMKFVPSKGGDDYGAHSKVYF